MGLFSKFTGDQKDIIISNLTKENRHLKIENAAYEEQLQDLKDIAEEYYELMNKVNDLRKDYEKRLHTLDKLTESYHKELEHITKQAKKNLDDGK